jgi:uncharacterized protein
MFRIPSAIIGFVAACAMTVIASTTIYAQYPADLQPSPPAQTAEQDTMQQQAGTKIPPDPGFASIRVLARPAEDSIVLRWAPTTPHGWRIGNRVGYLIERKTSGGESVRLTPQPIVPWEVEPWGEWMQKDSTNAFIGIAVYALYADTTLMGLADSLGQDTVGTNAERNANLFGYALFAADNEADIAAALGLRFVDRTVKRDVRYTYTITLARPQAYRVDPGTVEAATGTTAAGPAPQHLTANGGDGKIQLRWEPAPRIAYSAYNVFRSENRGRSYVKLNATPIAIVIPTDRDVPALGVFLDTTIVNYRMYRYHVKGIDAFGESGEAAEIETFGRDLTPPPQPRVTNAEQVGAAKLRMRWEMSESPGDLAGFNVMRSAYADSGYKKLNKRLLAPAVHEFVDEKAIDREPYYVISALDTAGNSALSYPLYGMLIDTVPPAIPTGLRGSVDSLGHVTLRWNRNREANILGYRVLRANAPDHEFTQLMGNVYRDTIFVDSIDVGTLTRYVYYRIAAVNARFGHSAMSAPIALRRQSRNLPTAPVFTDVVAGDRSVELHWAVNSEDKLRSIVLFRRNGSPERAALGRWDTLAALPRSARSFVDRRVVQKMTYEYQVAVVDSSSQSIHAELAVQARPFDTGVRSAVRKVTAVFAKETNSIRLDWTYEAGEADKLFFVIYRSVDGGEYISLKSVEGSLRTFADRALIGDGTYRYRLQAATQGGAESPLSDVVSILVGSTQK